MKFAVGLILLGAVIYTSAAPQFGGARRRQYGGGHRPQGGFGGNQYGGGFGGPQYGGGGFGQPSFSGSGKF